MKSKTADATQSEIVRLSNEGAEKAILGQLLLNNDSFYRCGKIQIEDFSTDATRTIFHRIATRISGGQSVDLVTLVAELDERKELAKVGNVGFVASLIEGVPERPHVDEYVRIVRDLSTRRRLVNACQSAVAQAYDGSETVSDCLSLMNDRLLAIAGKHKDGNSVKLSDFTFDVYDAIEKTSLMDPYVSIGLTSSIPQLDEITTGLRPGELWILGSWTGSGKTALLTQIMVENLKRNVPVQLFTQEMTRKQFAYRMIPQAMDGKVSARELRNPRHLSTAQLRLIRESQSIIDSWPLWINDAATLDIAELVASSHMAVHRHNVQLIGVDYLQLLSAPGESRYDRVSKVSGALRELAKTLNVPLVVVSQLSRPETKEKRAPRLFDLKESGQVENDAHVILFPFRPEDKEGHYTGDDVIIIAKQREGPTGAIRVEFNRQVLRFDSRAGLRDANDTVDMF